MNRRLPPPGWRAYADQNQPLVVYRRAERMSLRDAWAQYDDETSVLAAAVDSARGAFKTLRMVIENRREDVAIELAPILKPWCTTAGIHIFLRPARFAVLAALWNSFNDLLAWPNEPVRRLRVPGEEVRDAG